MDEKRNCDKHGYVLFKHRINKNGSWWVCEHCLREQWKKSSAKRREIPEVREFHKNYTKKANKIKMSLCIFLEMVFILSKNKPE